MTSKMKRCIDKLRRRTRTTKKHPSREALMSPQHDGLDEDTTTKQTESDETEAPACGLQIERIFTVEQKALDELTYWGPTKRIPEAQLAALLKRTVGHEPEFKLINRLNGAFNVAYILESPQGLKVCVRVPACGFPERWNRTDAELLRATALGMKYIENNSKLPIPRVLAYSTELANEISAPYTIMTFLEGKSVTFLWDDPGVERHVLEARRQKILQSLANIMCTLATTTFRRAGTLWFPDDDNDCHPVVGDSFRLDKDDIFTIRRDFLSFPPRDSVADLLRGGRDKRFKEDGFPEVYHGVTSTGLYILWDLMIEAFLQSGGVEAGAPEFVLMQSDFNPQNVLADEQTGNVTGIIDWDCLESIPRQIGWCSLPHWLEADWYPDYRWPPDIGVENSTKPDQYDRYRQDYTNYMREACQGRSDSVFTSRSHIYQALFDSVESFARVESFVYNVLADILPRLSSSARNHVGDIGEGGFRPGEREWFEARLVRYFAPDDENVGNEWC